MFYKTSERLKAVRRHDSSVSLSVTWTVGLSAPSASFADNTKLCGVADTLEGRDGIQRDLDRLERWVL